MCLSFEVYLNFILYVYFKLDEMREKYEDLKMHSEEKIREHAEKVSSTSFLFYV